MSRWSCCILTALLALILSSTPVAAQFPELQVINDSEDPALDLVDIYIDDGIYFEDIGYRLSTGFQQAPSIGQVEIGVAPGNSTSSADILATQSVTLASGTQTVVVIDGLVSSPKISHQALQPAPSSPRVSVTIFHGVPDAGVVDFKIEDTSYAANGVDHTEFGVDNSAVLNEGLYTLAVYTSGTSEILARYQLPLVVEGGQNVVVLATGYSMEGSVPEAGFFFFDESGSRFFMLNIPLPTYQSSFSALKALYGR